MRRKVHGIAKTYFEETVIKLQLCDGFSFGFDNSEMNKNHECEVMVMLSNKDTGIELRHYRTISLEGTDSETITRSLTDQMDDDKVPWREKLVATMSDWWVQCDGGMPVWGQEEAGKVGSTAQRFWKL